MFTADTLGCFKTRFGIAAIEAQSLSHLAPLDRRKGESVPLPPHSALQPRSWDFSRRSPLAEGFDGPPSPKNTDPAGPTNGPSAKIMFEKGTDHLDDKWASRHCQRVRAGETINGHTEAAASVMAEPVGGSPLLCLLPLNAVLFTHN